MLPGNYQMRYGKYLSHSCPKSYGLEMGDHLVVIVIVYMAFYMFWLAEFLGR